MSGFLGYQENYIRENPKDGYNYATVSVALVAPLSRGYVDIKSSDMADPLLVNPQWLTNPTDQAVAVAGYKRVRQLFNTTAMEPVLISPEYFPGTNVRVSCFCLPPPPIILRSLPSCDDQPLSCHKNH